MTTEYQPIPIPQRPRPPGSPEHQRWLIEATLELAARAGRPVSQVSREALIAMVSDIDASHVQSRDYMTFGGFSAFRHLVLSSPVLGEQTSTLPAIPDGYELTAISSQIHGDRLASQTMRSRPARQQARTVDQIPQGHAIAGVSTLVDGSGRLVGQWTKTARERETREQILERLLREIGRAHV